MLQELQSGLWSYLSKQAVATDVESVAAGLLGVAPDDASRVISARLAMSDEAKEFLAVAPELIRSLRAASATRMVVSRGRVSGRVDWRRTLTARSRHAGDPTVFVTSPSYRMYDHRRARALKYALEALLERIRVADLSPTSATFNLLVDISDKTEPIALGEALSKRVSIALRCLESAKLSGVRLLDATPDLQSLEGGSHAGWDAVVRFLELLSRVEGATSPGEAASMVSQVIWAPSSDGALFEWLVGFRLVSAYEALGYSPTHVSALSRKGIPFAELSGGRGAVRIYRQSPVVEESRYQTIKAAHSLGRRRLRPDFRIDQSWDSTNIVLEAKHTSGSGTSPINEALAESLAYIYDVQPYFDGAPFPVAVAVSSDQIGLAPEATEVSLCGPDRIAAAVELLIDRS